MKNEENRKPINLLVATVVIMEMAIAAMLVWSFLKNAWNLSWLAPYFGVILCLELLFYNTIVKKGQHPIKALYPTFIMFGFAFFFLLGFLKNGWSYSWIGLAIAAVCCLIILPIDLAIAKKEKKA